MAAGACDDCGCSRHECECSDRNVLEPIVDMTIGDLQRTIGNLTHRWSQDPENGEIREEILTLKKRFDEAPDGLLVEHFRVSLQNWLEMT